MRRDHSLTIALCGSLVIHFLVVIMLATLYVRRTGRVTLASRSQPSAFAEAPDVPPDELGKALVTGDATDADTGELDQQAPKASQTQAFLGLDPPGLTSAAKQSASSALTPAPVQPPAPQQRALATPFGLPDDHDDLVSGEAKHAEPKPEPATPPTVPSEQTASAQPEQASPGLPAEQAKTESDPVSVTASARFRPGHTEIQLGRDHKITRPHLSLAAQADLMSLADPLLTLKITTDATGHVLTVAIFKSSGSGNIDEGCKLAAYGWWFEPAKDLAGANHGDVILFNIRFI